MVISDDMPMLYHVIVISDVRVVWCSSCRSVGKEEGFEELVDFVGTHSCVGE